MPEEKVVLHVPAQSKYARMVRISAAHVGSLLHKVTLDEIEDVRMAAEEAFVYALATGIQDEIKVTLSIEDNALHMRFPLGSMPVEDDAIEPAMTYSALILGEMCDEYEITDAPDAELHLVKRVEETHGK